MRIWWFLKTLARRGLRVVGQLGRFGALRAEHRFALLVRPFGLPSYMDTPVLPSCQFMMV